MARSNNSSSANYFTVASWPITTLPFSVSMWLRFGSITTANTLQVTHGINQQFTLQVLNTGLVIAQTRNALAGFSQSSGGATLATGTWYQVGGIWRAGSNWRNHYVNGVAGTANTDTRSVSVSISIASMMFTTASNAEIADLTAWNADIGADGMLQHAKGFAGRLIRPEALMFYAPFVRGKTEHKAEITVTENGTMTETDHPPIIGAIAS